MMRGYLTVFLSLSLSVVTGFILLLTGNAIRNAGKVRLECAVDTGMDAVLSEFHIHLFERYGLFYVDASYLGSPPAVSNIEGRLRYYIEENTSQVLTGKGAPWGRLNIENAAVWSFETAAADQGASMRSQAVICAEDEKIYGEEREVISQMEEIRALDSDNPLERWRNVMEQISGMELPHIQNEKGIWEEVPLSNPADWVYELAGSDALYLAETDLQYLQPASVMLQDYISHRPPENITGGHRNYREEQDLFLSYLFDKMGYFGCPREESLLTCQLEYIVQGKESDLKNMQAVAGKLFEWRFADNLSRALADGDLRAQALAAADLLLAVTLNPAFREPVAESILYACAFLESIGDVKTIYTGGRIPVRKSEHQMSVSRLLGGGFYRTDGESGFSYRQYLAGMILMMDDRSLNLRAMDVMEMDVRLHDGNHYFAMDWCVERFEAEITGGSGYGNHYELRRKYGYF